MSSADPDLADKTIFRNLVRAGSPNFNTVGKTLLKVLEYFNWHTISIMGIADNFCGFGAKSIESIFKTRKDFFLAENILVKSNDSKSVFESALRKMSLSSRGEFFFLFFQYKQRLD